VRRVQVGFRLGFSRINQVRCFAGHFTLGRMAGRTVVVSHGVCWPTTGFRRVAHYTWISGNRPQPAVTHEVETAPVILGYMGIFWPPIAQHWQCPFEILGTGRTDAEPWGIRPKVKLDNLKGETGRGIKIAGR